MLERQKQKEKEQNMNFNVEQRISEWITHYSEVTIALIPTIYKLSYLELPKFHNNVMVWTAKRCKK